MSRKKYELCYINDQKAFFTGNLKKQWGDDWNDTPYEHNAGDPYDDHGLKAVFFEGNFIAPEYLYSMESTIMTPEVTYIPKYDQNNSDYSVDMINEKNVPWLVCTNNLDKIFAGTTIEEFADFIKRNGGKVYVEA